MAVSMRPWVRRNTIAFRDTYVCCKAQSRGWTYCGDPSHCRGRIHTTHGRFPALCISPDKRAVNSLSAATAAVSLMSPCALQAKWNHIVTMPCTLYRMPSGEYEEKLMKVKLQVRPGVTH